MRFVLYLCNSLRAVFVICLEAFFVACLFMIHVPQVFKLLALHCGSLPPPISAWFPSYGEASWLYGRVALLTDPFDSDVFWAVSR